MYLVCELDVCMLRFDLINSSIASFMIVLVIHEAPWTIRVRKVQ